jgi:hypothetical protein
MAKVIVLWSLDDQQHIAGHAGVHSTGLHSTGFLVSPVISAIKALSACDGLTRKGCTQGRETLS